MRRNLARGLELRLSRLTGLDERPHVVTNMTRARRYASAIAGTLSFRWRVQSQLGFSSSVRLWVFAGSIAGCDIGPIIDHAPWYNDRSAMEHGILM
jgi:hypothetical protein